MYKEYEVENGTGAMAAVKIEVFIWLWHENYYYVRTGKENQHLQERMKVGREIFPGEGGGRMSNFRLVEGALPTCVKFN